MDSEYTVIYELGTSRRLEGFKYFTDALSRAEELYHSGISYVDVKDNCGAILVEFEN